ncbi:MAG: hypothetical protein Aurels2KO_55880 [Aureliella sp.]
MFGLGRKVIRIWCLPPNTAGWLSAVVPSDAQYPPNRPVFCMHSREVTGSISLVDSKQLMDDLIAKFVKHMPESNDITLIVLKGHLLVEEHLEIIINGFLPNHNAMQKARLTFHHKAAIAQSICWRRPEDEIWSLIFAINSLRNDLAHNLESQKRYRKVQEVLKQHTEMSVNDPDIRDVEECSDQDQLRLAFSHILGFLERFRRDIEGKADFIHQLLDRGN